MKEKIKSLLASGKTKRALELSRDFLKNGNNESLDEIYLLLNQFNTVTKSKSLGLIEKENETNRIVKALLEILNENDVSINESQNSNSIKSYSIKKIVTIIGLLFITTLVSYFVIESIYSNESIYKHYQASLGPTAIVSREYLRETNMVFLSACNAFSEGRFTDSKKIYDSICDSIKFNLIQFNDIDEKKTILAKAKYAGALNRMFLNESEEAIKNFDEYISFEKNLGINNSRTNLSEWGKLLCKIQSNDLDEEFKTELQRVIDNKLHLFNNQAVQLRDKLSSPWRILLNEKRI